MIPDHFKCPMCGNNIIGHKFPIYKDFKIISEVCIDCWNKNHITNFEELVKYYLHSPIRKEAINEDRRKSDNKNKY